MRFFMATLILAAAVFANADLGATRESNVAEIAKSSPADTGQNASQNQNQNQSQSQSQSDQSGFLIQNDPILKPTNIITIRAIGLGVGNENLTNRAQVMALAKRAAIVDAYRQLGEKLHGIRIDSRDVVKDAMLVRSEVRTAVYSIVRGAEIVETIWSDNLCQVEMEVKLDGRRWYKVLSGL
ncbi:hypothetical protein FACS189487_08700 [Campylobacterota bacterium]|nr:hypothetical protein FACS189487_08700 [Campylobacterota bacterium]